MAHRADERFAFASTVKALVAGAVLDDLDAPPRPDVRRALRAAVVLGDNDAANELFAHLGGPPGLAAALRRIGDTTTSVDRGEPELNTARPGDTRDTTTPRALVASLRAYLLGDVLPPADRALLGRLLERSRTGHTLIRAGVPDGWAVGDKSGAAAFGTRNDVAVLTPPGRAPIVVAVMSTRDATGDPDAAYDDALVADAARIVVRALAG